MKMSKLIGIVLAALALSGCEEKTEPKADKLLCSFQGEAYAYFAKSWERRMMLIRTPNADDMCLPIKVSRSAEAVG